LSASTPWLLTQQRRPNECHVEVHPGPRIVRAGIRGRLLNEPLVLDQLEDLPQLADQLEGGHVRPSPCPGDGPFEPEGDQAETIFRELLPETDETMGDPVGDDGGHGVVGRQVDAHPIAERRSLYARRQSTRR